MFKTFYIVILILIFTNSWVYSQDQSSIFKLGVEAGVGIFKPDDINQLIDSWLHEQFDIVEIQGDIKVRPDINLSGYVSFAFIRYLELRLEIEYLYAPTLFDSFDSDDLNIIITSYNPGISINLKLGILQFGGGIFKYFSKIEWEDNVFHEANDNYVQQQTHSSLKKYSTESYDLNEINYDVFPISVGLEYFFLKDNFSPYSVFEIGYNFYSDKTTISNSKSGFGGVYDTFEELPTEYKSKAPAIPDDNSYRIALGVGTNYRLSSAINLDVRYVYQINKSLVNTNQFLVGINF